MSKAPTKPPYALTIASSDSSGGAGIQADLKTMTRFGVYGGSVIVSTTAQNTQGVDSTHVLPPAEIRAQYKSIIEDIDIDVIKLGMLATAEAIETVDDCLTEYNGPVVIDPVMVATSGDRLLAEDAIDAYTDLFAHATLLTPNADETEALTGVWPDTAGARERAAEQFFTWGVDAVLFKGGHVRDDADTVQDILITADAGTQLTVTGDRVETAHTHGSGCTLASGIAARLAHGVDVETAVTDGVNFVQTALQNAATVGSNGSVNHLVELAEDTEYSS
ncbi:bifunctional hydroxymethylpyrimidine kinase/phosphomethylpyrimidine kinase [Haloquadratum walsbyi]|jgi:phosphomethylpyrimidine kinase|uniref:Phosphomethylpyrimidine kinase n=1 Tax=Haloquadratum walsbyi J07HQW2 TaxID=1238425 RepID=U1NDN7_9EURY|nr:bifunctional hydroxymethylpyrimidine kinase/phosphomethylpyrimidine kinase [Haloquadratum walsbyi]ERG94848.1 MAG: phosphomethylpyrimidine kinase [Haloquadratum walsbyi J07HQW2]